MKSYKNNHFILLLLFVFSVAPVGLHAADLIDNSNDVFKFQQKLANNGNAQAQYKLGTMYEAGEGVTVDITQAKHWYDIAAQAGSESAAQRSSYLNIKEKGFVPARDTVWLNSVKTDAGEQKAGAIYLLGQLYQNGIGVEKNLDESLILYKQIKSLGEANVEREIAAINKEKAETLLALQKQQEQREAQAQQAQEAQQQHQRELVNQKKQAEIDEQLEQAEKRKRYEAVMLELKLEQQKIKAQQSRVSGDSIDSVDEEI